MEVKLWSWLSLMWVHVMCACTSHGLHMTQRAYGGQTVELVVSFSLMWVLELVLRLPHLGSKHLYPLNISVAPPKKLFLKFQKYYQKAVPASYSLS